MKTKQKLKNIILKLWNVSLFIKIPSITLLIIFISCLMVFLQEKPVTFSYGTKTCVPQFVLFPDINKVSGSNYGFDVQNENIINIGKFRFMSLDVCFNAKEAPYQGDVKISIAPFGGWFMKKTYKMSVPEPPVVNVAIFKDPLPTAKPLTIKLSSDDSIYDYQLEINDKSAECPMSDSAIHCDIVSLKLDQGKDYEAALIRMFETQKIETIISEAVKTIDATNLVKSSLSQEQVIYDKTKEFNLDFDKDVVKAEVSIFQMASPDGILIKSSAQINAKTIKIIADDEFSRDTNYELRIDDLVAIDGSTLLEPLRVKFKVSDGPAISNNSAGTFGLFLNQSIVLTFDQNLDLNQNLVDYISVTGVNATFVKKNNQIIINYKNAPMCTDININIKAGLLSNNGIVQNDPWSFSTRTLCHTSSVIGYSVNGRAIISHSFGSGNKSVLFIGSIHGNERSTNYLMNDWIDELEQNIKNIPADKRIVVIPSLNPDGLAANIRNNYNGVDLNRNFPTADWQSDVYAPDNSIVTNGGGLTSLSEPESQAIANYMDQLKPVLVLSYHSTANYVIANDAGNSAELAKIYAGLSGYTNMTGVSDAFSYPITGTYDTWLFEKKNITSLIVELSSISNSQFSRNKEALWAMVNS